MPDKPKAGLPPQKNKKSTLLLVPWQKGKELAIGEQDIREEMYSFGAP